MMQPAENPIRSYVGTLTHSRTTAKGHRDLWPQTRKSKSGLGSRLRTPSGSTVWEGRKYGTGTGYRSPARKLACLVDALECSVLGPTLQPGNSLQGARRV